MDLASPHSLDARECDLHPDNPLTEVHILTAIDSQSSGLPMYISACDFKWDGWTESETDGTLFLPPLSIGLTTLKSKLMPISSFRSSHNHIGVSKCFSDPVRSVFWRGPEWEKTSHVWETHQVWPAPDVAASLMNAYFLAENEWKPLLDRLGFER